LKRIKVIIPPQYQDKNVPTVREFYDKLLQVILSSGAQLTLCKDKKHFEESNADIGIAYHTHSAGLVNVKIGYLPDYFYVDKLGYSGWSTLANTDCLELPHFSEAVNDRFNEFRREIVGKNISKYPQPAPTRFSVEETVERPLTLFTQTTEDTVAHFMPMPWHEFIKRLVIRIFSINPRESIVIKRHPRCTDGRVSKLLADLKEQYGDKLSLSGSSIHELIPRSKAIIVGNSGVGFEALLHLCPIFTFAKSDYVQATIPVDLDSFAGYQSRIDAFSETDRQKMKSFVVYYLDSYMTANNEESIRNRLRSLGVI
jgi:hypothetical protein